MLQTKPTDLIIILLLLFILFLLFLLFLSRARIITQEWGGLQKG